MKYRFEESDRKTGNDTKKERKKQEEHLSREYLQLATVIFAKVNSMSERKPTLHLNIIKLFVIRMYKVNE